MPVLFTNTMQPATLSLLYKLMTVPALYDFLLVGGTNLSLRYGHRVSVDQPFDRDELVQDITSLLPQTTLLDQRK